MTFFLRWFYIDEPRRILQTGRNFLIFGWHFFSIGYFLPRLFSPWHRDLSGYGRGLDLKRILHVLGWNLISRLIGAILRIAVIILGIAFETAVAAATLAWFIFWFVLPLASAAFLILGFRRLFIIWYF